MLNAECKSDVTKNNTLIDVTEDNEALNYNTHVDASNDVTEDVNPLNDVTEISNTSDDVTDSGEKIVPEMKQEYQGKLKYLLRINRPLSLRLYHRSAGKIGNLGLFSAHKNKALPVVYFDQLSGACCTRKLVETFFSDVFRPFLF